MAPDRLENGVLQRIPNTFVTGDPLERLPNTANIAFEYIQGDAIPTLLSRVGIACSAGSACSSGGLEPSHVLRAMKMPHGVVRFSFARDNGEEDVDRVLEVMPAIVERLRDVRNSGPGTLSTEDLQSNLCPGAGTTGSRS
ncbi:hypothetical protein AJ88_21925 [Mesorhizobium amorphae CCBAU 01583]|nr:hypothetical protein AJ88_21925 [Mesorhizobium amorphae CCBAU 01583]